MNGTVTGDDSSGDKAMFETARVIKLHLRLVVDR